MKKFNNYVDDFVELESRKINTRYKMFINIDLFLIFEYYKRIEKRGFRVVEKETGKEIKDSSGFLAIFNKYTE